jgi:hypothetical protein
MPSTPTRFPSGVATQPPLALFANLPEPNPVACEYYVNDFTTYAAGDWTVTTVNSGASALATGLGGWLVLTPGATATNFQGNTLVPASFNVAAGFQSWFGISLKLSDAISANSPSFLIGMTGGTGGPSAPTDGVYFTKASGANKTISAVMRKSSTSTTIANLASSALAADDTFFTLGWYYDGKATPTIYFYTSLSLTASSAFGTPPNNGGVVVASASSDPLASVAITNIPLSTTLLAPQFYMVEPGTTQATMTVDWIFAASQINRP